MADCVQCGHLLGVGRFCTNCGHPVDGSSAPTFAERAPAAVPSPPRRASGHRHVDESRRGAYVGPALWVVGLAMLLALGGTGLWLFLGPGDEATAPDPTSGPTRQEQSRSDPSPPQGPESLSPTPRDEPDEPETPVDLVATTTVSAPRPAPATQDTGGNPVRFVAAHLVDGIPETCWRMRGDGTGEAITFTFAEPTELSEVGLVNGYAKTGQDSQGLLDWYAGNRRTLEVEWTFDDGTVLTQDLRQTREMQTVRLDPAVTEQVTLRLIEVTPPGQGRASRDYTAISDVTLVGAPTRAG